MRQILHIDMDAFYASVEQRDDPSLRGKAVIVGGPTRRGVVCAASYEARKFGVHSAMSMGEAIRLCPHARVMPVRHAVYAEVSRQVFSIFHRYTPLVEGLSLDEAFLDVTASRSLWGSGRDIALLIKKAIQEETQLTASAGVAPVKFVAKIASDLQKPDGLVVIEEDDVATTLGPLPIEKMWGLGRKGAPRAHSTGFHTFGDLQRAEDQRLTQVFGTHGPAMKKLALGIDPRQVDPDREAKSIGAEETFAQDLSTDESLSAKLLSQSERVAERLFVDGLASKGITVKLKYADFRIETRSLQLPEPVADRLSIHRAALTLLARFERRGRGVRLCGISAHGLVPIASARFLFPDPEVARGKKLEAALASVRERFGRQVRSATLLDED